ncbi:hypothetical protein C9374_008038 [Naegleria lovaniensis]|uniref:Uncharacterized protein n=1 Tax=Naegleria lovaniensis TaxID=51637 RepID=A0AA88GLC6_NAELO|nr:uncharacterized protein C9374_008038 [Naegleria lovaniensis]KAG2378890.1 hypothetical protein C9374_008038 [Naegleria lovaniensis]
MHKCSRCGSEVKTIRYDTNAKHWLFMCVNENCTFPFDLDNFEDYLCEDDDTLYQQNSTTFDVPNGDQVICIDDTSPMNKRNEIIDLISSPTSPAQNQSDNITDLFKEYF